MYKLLAFPIFCTCLVLFAAVTLRRFRVRFAAHPLCYRVTFSALVALLCPTLLMAGHGVLPVPTFTGVVIAMMQMESLGDLRLSYIAFGSKDAAVLIQPFVICFILVFATPWSKQDPALRSEPW